MVVVVVATVVVVVAVVVASIVWEAGVAGYVGVAAVPGVTTKVRVAGETAHVEMTHITDVSASPRCQYLLIEYKT
jgi:hypothetical protein